MKLLKWIFLSPFILVFGLIGFVIIGVVLCELNKAYWDSRVRELCETQAGNTVFEKVTLTKEEYELNEPFRGDGQINVGPRRTSKDHLQYAYDMKREYIRKGFPDITKTTAETFRKSDGKVLGVWVTFRRSGGDFPTIIGHPSGFGCREINKEKGIRIDIIDDIFTYNKI